MGEYIAALKVIWNREPLTCVAVIAALVAALAALIETATRPWR